MSKTNKTLSSTLLTLICSGEVCGVDDNLSAADDEKRKRFAAKEFVFVRKGESE